MKNIKLYFTIIVFAIFTVPTGTIIHEFGHYLFARYIGEEANIKYNITVIPKYYKMSKIVKSEVDNYFKNINPKIIEGVSIEWNSIKYILSGDVKLEYIEYLNGLKFIAIGGPLITILFGSISFIILIIKFKNKKICLNFINLILIFVSFFWLREIFGLLQILLAKNLNTLYTDELIISRLYNLPLLSIISILALISFIVFFTVIYKIEERFRVCFIFSTFLGSILGYYFWFYIFGPIILP